MVASLDSFESSDLFGDPPGFRRQLGDQGFLFFRNLLPAAAVGEVRAAILAAIGQEGWLAAGTEPEDRRPGPVVVREADERWWPAYQRIQSLECFHRLAYHEKLLGVVDGHSRWAGPRPPAQDRPRYLPGQRLPDAAAPGLPADPGYGPMC